MFMSDRAANGRRRAGQTSGHTATRFFERTNLLLPYAGMYHQHIGENLGMGSRLDRITDWENRARRVNYRVARLARGVAMTPRQLERHFLEMFVRHPKQWMQDLLMQDALRLMRRGMLAKEIAQRLGFKHVSSFCRAFRQYHGASLKSLRTSRVVPLRENVAKC